MEKSRTYAIVVVGYNRPYEMERLLRSICNAKMENIIADLIISLDFSDKQEQLQKLAETVHWQHGEKIIRTFAEHQGLKNHILQCGDLTSQYDAVVVCEDDIVVAPGFMQYVVETVKKYAQEDAISGISLYSYRTNPGNGRFFEAQNNGYDVFLLQYAQSWGQCWTSKMWQQFRLWYNEQTEKLVGDKDFPNHVANWDERSWLKYYIKYTVETEKYFVYPYFSLTTNCSAVGEHCERASIAYQVPLQLGIHSNYRLPDVTDAVKYDAFFERKDMEGIFEQKYGNVLLDLYGLRTFYGNADTLISVQALPYQVIQTIGLCYCPVEQNVLTPVEGTGIFVYDLHHKSKKPKINMVSNIANYEFKAQNWRMTLRYTIDKLVLSVKRRLGIK